MDPPLMEAPNEFGNPLARWMHHHCKASVVYVEFRPNRARVLQAWNDIDPITQGPGAAERLAARDEQSGAAMRCTGFFLSVPTAPPHRIHVLTVAHALHPVFNAGFPITAAQAERMYQPWILCEHLEQAFLDGHEQLRRFTRGHIVNISCQNDLLVIQLTQAHMAGYCEQVHWPLSVAQRFPSCTDSVMMLSWPEVGRSAATARGEISHPDRMIQYLGGRNPFGFTTRLSEVGIRSEQGSSGAPLLDGWGEVVGVLHGGNTVVSFFVGLTEIRNTLMGWGLI